MATIKFIRVKENSNRLVKYSIYINEAEVTSIKNEEEKEVVVEAGVYMLCVKMGLYKSADLRTEITEDEKKTFTIRIAKNGTFTSSVGVILLCLLLVAAATKNFNFVPLLILGVVILFVYELAIARHKRFELIEGDEVVEMN